MGTLKLFAASKCTVVILYLLIRAYKWIAMTDVLKDKNGKRIGWQYLPPFTQRIKHAVFCVDIACLEGIEAYGFLSGSMSKIPFWFGVAKVLILGIFFIWLGRASIVEARRIYAIDNDFAKFNPETPTKIEIDPDMKVPARQYIWPIVLILLAMAAELTIIITYAINIQV